MPPVLGPALLAATILAIIVSTADSYLLTSANALVRDVYQRFLRPTATEAQLLRTRAAAGLRMRGDRGGDELRSDRYFRVAFFAYTIYGVGITPPLLAALFWKRATPARRRRLDAGRDGTIAIAWASARPLRAGRPRARPAAAPS